jgi:hypothetical protein
LQAESLLVAGSHNEANADGASDVLDFRNTANLFSLVNQVVMRHSAEHVKMGIQCRGYSRATAIPGSPEILLALQDGIRSQSMLTPLGRMATDALYQDGFRCQFVDGSPETAGYEISCVPQAQYLAECPGKEFAVLWLSPTLREVFQPQENEYSLQAQLKALDVPLAVDDLAGFLKQHLISGRKTVIPPELKTVLDRYVQTMDIVCLQQAVARWPDFCFSGFLDRNSQQLVLLISDGAEALPAVLNLRPRLTAPPEDKALDDVERVQLFLASRNPWLEWSL